MKKLKLTLACGRYDRTQPLIDGRVEPEGSRPTLDALLRHLDEQKLTRRPMKVEELFVPNISPGLNEYLRATAEE